MNKKQQTDFLIAYTVDRLTEYLMSDHNLALASALRFIYNSETYQKLQQSENSLCAHSPAYVYEMLDSEYRTGKMI